jgi:hypothetical protein
MNKKLQKATGDYQSLAIEVFKDQPYESFDQLSEELVMELKDMADGMLG